MTFQGTKPPHRNSRKTHCPKGHPYDGGNTKVWGGRRFCLTCQENKDRRRQSTRSWKRRCSPVGTGDCMTCRAHGELYQPRRLVALKVCAACARALWAPKV